MYSMEKSKKTVRMRYPEQALEELKREDPETAVSLRFIRRLAASGKIPVVKIGRRHLINYDALLDYLASPDNNDEVPRGVIRRIG